MPAASKSPLDTWREVADDPDAQLRPAPESSDMACDMNESSLTSEWRGLLTRRWPRLLRLAEGDALLSPPVAFSPQASVAIAVAVAPVAVTLAVTVASVESMEQR